MQNINSGKTGLIHRLDDGTLSSLQSSLVLRSLTQIVETLFRNAVASCLFLSSDPQPSGLITITFDFPSWAVIVKHDGSGWIPEIISGLDPMVDMLSFIGVVHIRTFTSKKENPEPSDTTMIYKDGQRLFCGATSTKAASTSMSPLRPETGTIIAVRDVYHKIPVRRASLRSLANQKKHTDKVVNRIKELALVYPALSIRITAKYDRLTQVSDQGMVKTEEDDKVILRLTSAKDMASRFGQVFGSEYVSLFSIGKLNHQGAFKVKGARSCPNEVRMVRLRLSGFVSSVILGRSAQIVLLNDEKWPDRRLRTTDDEQLTENEDQQGYFARQLDAFGLDWEELVAEDREGPNPWKQGSRPRSSHRGSYGGRHISIYETINDMIHQSVGRGDGPRQGSQFPYLIHIGLEFTSESQGGRQCDESCATLKELTIQNIIQTVKQAVLDSLCLGSMCQTKRKTDRPHTTGNMALIQDSAAHTPKRPKTAHIDGRQKYGDRKRQNDQNDIASADNAKTVSAIAKAEQAVPEGMMVWNDPITQKRFFIDKRTGNSYDCRHPRFQNADPQSGGHTMEAEEHKAGPPSDCPKLSKFQVVDRSRLKKTQSTSQLTMRDRILARSEEGSDKPPEWLQQSLKDWTNPCFDSLARDSADGYATQEEPIPKLSSLISREGQEVGVGLLDPSVKQSLEQDLDLEVEVASTPPLSTGGSPIKTFSNLGPLQARLASRLGAVNEASSSSNLRSRFFTTHSNSPRDVERAGASSGHCHAFALHPLQEALSKQDLSNTKVIGQVDGKYIMCRVPSIRENGSSLLICIDQHAADERTLLERLLQEYLGGCLAGDPSVTILAQPLNVAIGREEYDALSKSDRVTEGLAFWGFGKVSTHLIDESLGLAQVRINTMPQIIQDRVMHTRIEMELVTSILKDVIQQLDKMPSLPGSSQTDWLAASRYLPRRMMKLIQSKACRSAIMFNDQLSIEACQRIVERLGECRFPFQCAHGRPSIVPICRI